MKIMIVAEDVNILRLFYLALENYPWPFKLVSDPYEALREYERSINNGSCFDLVLTDIDMQGMDGFTLFERLKKDYPYAQEMIMTSFQDVVQMIEKRGNNSYNFVVKPFCLRECVELIEKIRVHQKG